MDEKEQAEIGAKWGEILGMHYHQDERRHSIPDTWELTTGWKTSLGLFRTICRMADEARGVDVEKLKAERDDLAETLRLIDSHLTRILNHSAMVNADLRDRVETQQISARAALAKLDKEESQK